MHVVFPGSSKGLAVGGFYQEIQISIVKQLLCGVLDTCSSKSYQGTRLTEEKGNGERCQTECS